MNYPKGTRGRGHIARRMGFDTGATYWCGAAWDAKLLSYYTASAAQKAKAKGQDICDECIRRALAARKTFTPTALDGTASKAPR